MPKSKKKKQQNKITYSRSMLRSESSSSPCPVVLVPPSTRNLERFDVCPNE